MTATASVPDSFMSNLLVGLEMVTGTAAVIGGTLLVVRADGSLLRADPSALHGSPFHDWRLPGLLLFALVGIGMIVTGFAQHRCWASATSLSLLAGIGLVAFEVVELMWLGFQPLEAVFALIGVAISGLATVNRLALRGK